MGEIEDPEVKLVKDYLLTERDRKVRSVLGVGQKEIARQFIVDLYRLPGSGGSDERAMAKSWFFRSGSLFLHGNQALEQWESRRSGIDSLFSQFREPFFEEIRAIAGRLGQGRSR